MKMVERKAYTAFEDTLQDIILHGTVRDKILC